MCFLLSPFVFLELVIFCTEISFQSITSEWHCHLDFCFFSAVQYFPTINSSRISKQKATAELTCIANSSARRWVLGAYFQHCSIRWRFCTLCLSLSLSIFMRGIRIYVPKWLFFYNSKSSVVWKMARLWAKTVWKDWTCYGVFLRLSTNQTWSATQPLKVGTFVLHCSPIN